MARHGLIISYYFPPVGGGGVQRWIKLIKYLSKYDWQFTVITASSESSAPQDPSLLNEIPSETKIIRLAAAKPDQVLSKKAGSPTGNVYWQRWLSAFFHITDSREKWNRLAEPVIAAELERHVHQVLIFSSPPYSLAKLAAKISTYAQIPVILDMRDPWTINPYKIHPTKFHLRLDRMREKKTIRGLKYFISTYESTLDHFTRSIKPIPQNDRLLLPNGYDEADFRGIGTVKPKRTTNFSLAFSGTIYSHINNPINLFRAMQKLKKKGHNIDFHHIGISAYDLSAVAAKFGLESQFYAWGYKNHQECLNILAGMDAFCLFLDDRHPHSDKTVGGKLYEYLRLKKPVLALIPITGEAADVIKETDSGLVCSGKNIDEIIHSVELLLSGDKNFKFRQINKYLRANQAAELNIFLENVLKDFS